MKSSLAIRDVNAAAYVLPDLPHYSPHDRSKSLQIPSSIRPHNGERREAMSSEGFHKTLRERIAIAMRRRVGIGKAITPKQLAYATQLSLGTIDNLLSGNNDPSGRALMALLTFFDSAFANEILAPTGCTVAKLSDARAAALRKVAEGMAELRQLG